MAKITRYNGNLKSFGADSTSTNRTVFGDTSQSDTLDDNLNTEFFEGWEIVGTNDAPPKNWFNAVGYTLGQLLAYLHQVGVAEWNTLQEYHNGSVCSDGAGNVFVSKVDVNTGNALPVNENTEWKRLLDINDTGYGSKAIGEPFCIMENLTGILEPSNAGSKKFIKLTAGLTGVDEYNEGLLDSEVISGSAPNVSAVADIALADSPIFGETLHLINTEGSFLRAGETAGTLTTYKTGRPQDTAFNTGSGGAHTHTNNRISANSGGLDGISANGAGSGRSGGGSYTIVSNSSDHSHSITSGGDTETAPKNVTAIYYMRIL